MNQRFVSVLVFAFIVATGASVLLYRLMASRVTSKPEGPTNKVIMAARNLEAGTLIKDSDLKEGEWHGALPAGAIVKKEDAIGRGVVASMYDSEPLLESRLAPKGGGAGLAAMIPPGMRAVAVRVNEVVGVAGFAVPGMRVDVLVSGSPPVARASVGNMSKTVLQNIEVLSAGQDFKKDAEGKPVLTQVVNLLVTPEQAEMLSLAANEMRIQLVLRNPLDTQVAKTNGAAVSQMFGMSLAAPIRDPDDPLAPPKRVAKPKPAPPPAAPVVAEKPKEPFVVEMISGVKKTEAKFTEVK